MLTTQESAVAARVFDIDDVGGALEVETSYKNLSVHNAKGSVRAANRHGRIEIQLEQPPKSDITVNGDYTDVRVEIPASSVFTIDGQTQFGEIYSEFDSASISSMRRQRSMRGQQGSGGPHIRVETQHGSIRLEKRG